MIFGSSDGSRIGSLLSLGDLPDGSIVVLRGVRGSLLVALLAACAAACSRFCAECAVACWWLC